DLCFTTYFATRKINGLTINNSFFGLVAAQFAITNSKPYSVGFELLYSIVFTFIRFYFYWNCLHKTLYGQCHLQTFCGIGNNTFQIIAFYNTAIDIELLFQIVEQIIEIFFNKFAILSVQAC